MKQPVARGRQTGEKRQGTRGKERESPARLQAFTPRRLPKPSLLRDAYIFWQRAIDVKQLGALESDSSGGFAKNEVRGHCVVGGVQFVLADKFFERGEGGKGKLRTRKNDGGKRWLR